MQWAIHTTASGASGAGAGEYPCLDELGRYKSFPCGECAAPSCWAGRKPIAVRPRPVLAPGERACEVCHRAFRAYGRGRYCRDECRRRAVARQRRRRKYREGLGIY